MISYTPPIPAEVMAIEVQQDAVAQMRDRLGLEMGMNWEQLQKAARDALYYEVAETSLFRAEYSMTRKQVKITIKGDGRSVAIALPMLETKIRERCKEYQTYSK